MHTKDKNIDAFRAIYEEHKDVILKIVMRYSNINYHVAQEITQEVFIKLYEHFNTYEEDYLFQWLVITAKNAALDYLKKGIREIPDENIVFDEEKVKMVPSAEETVLDRIETENRIQEGRYLLDQLYEINERWYEAVTMVYCEGRKQQEVADILGVSIGVLHGVLHRAKRWVRENYKPDKEK